MGDPRKEPEDDKKAVITGVRRSAVLKKLETLAPTPSQPPRDEPGSVLSYMLALAQMHRSDAAYAAARAEEAAGELAEEIDHVKAHVLKLGGKLERLEERVSIVVNTQITQNSAITALQTKITSMQSVFEGTITNLHARVNMVEAEIKRDRVRMDDFERAFGEVRELIMDDVSLRKRQLEFDEIHNGSITPSSGADADSTSDPDGPETLRPRPRK